MGVFGLSIQNIGRGIPGYPVVVIPHLKNELHFRASCKEEYNNIFICSCDSPYVTDLETCI
jgi:hypothetical protein